MRSRALVLAGCALLCALAACGGHEKKVSVKTPVTAGPAIRRAAPEQKDVPKILLQVGTAYQTGALVRFCIGSTCSTSSATPPKALKASDPLLFIVDQAPRSASVRLTPIHGNATADQRMLHVGTTMLYAPAVKAGTYLVHLDAVWSGRKAGWVFAIAVP
ncbi:MAG: hypothetical protein ACXVES_03200 [Actinomycetota bacterium]